MTIQEQYENLEKTIHKLLPLYYIHLCNPLF